MSNQEIHSIEQWEPLFLHTFGNREALAEILKPDLPVWHSLKQNLGGLS